jgi:hypothetical protein
VYKRILQTCAYNWRSTLTETLKPFTGWYSSFFPPNLNHLDSFTANFRIPLKNSFFTELYDDLDIYGYPKNPALFLRPFQPEDIIIVTDGFCSSGEFRSRSVLFFIIFLLSISCGITFPEGAIIYIVHEDSETSNETDI